MTHLVLSELFVTNLLLFEHTHTQKKKCSLAEFFGPYGVRQWLKEGCRKPVLRVWVRYSSCIIFRSKSLNGLIPKQRTD